MKRYAWALFAVMLLLIMAFADTACAEKDTLWSYEVRGDGTAVLTKYLGSETDFTVPQTVDGRLVTGLAGGAIDRAVFVEIPVTVTDLAKQCLPDTATVIGWHGSAALAYAAQHGQPTISRSLMDFVDGVIDLTQMNDHKKVAGGFQMPAAYARLLSEGMCFYIAPANSQEMGLTYKVTGPVEDGYVPAAMAQAWEAYHSYTFEAHNLQPDYARATYAEGVTLVDYDPLTASTEISMVEGGMRLQSRAAGSVQFPGTELSNTVNLNIKINQYIQVSGKLTYTFGLRNITVGWSKNWYSPDSFHVEVFNDYTLEGGIQFAQTNPGPLFLGVDESGDDQSRHRGWVKWEDETGDVQELFGHNLTPEWITIADYPIATPSGIFIHAKLNMGINVTGKIVFTLSIGGVTHIDWKDGQLSYRTESPHTEKSFEMAACAVFAAGPAVTVSLAFLPDFLELQLSAVKLEIDERVQFKRLGLPCFDTTVKLGWEFTLGFGLKRAAQFVFGKNKTGDWDTSEIEDKTWYRHLVNFWNEFSYYRDYIPPFTRHYEPGNGWVDECTRNGGLLHMDMGDMPGGAVYDRYLPYGGTYTADDVNVPDTTRIGYDFLGWFDESGNQFDETLGSCDWQEKTVYARWERRADADWDYAVPEYRELDYSMPPASWGPDINVRNVSNPLSYHINKFYQEYDYDDYKDSYVALLDGSNVVLFGRHGDNSGSLTSITYPERFIGTDGHMYSPNLSSVTFPERMEDIGTYMWCPSLTSMRLPSALLTLRDSAFYACTGLKTVEMAHTSIPYIPRNGFAGTSNLETLDMPETVTTIQNNAFHNSGIQRFTAPGLREIEYNAFDSATRLTNVTLPDQFETIWHAAFSGCSSLTTVTGHVENVCGRAFENCAQLTSVILNGEEISVDSGVFHNTPSLDTVSITATGNVAFDMSAFASSGVKTLRITGQNITLYGVHGMDCESMTTVIIQASGTVSIGEYCFAGMKNLTNLSIEGSVSQIGANAFLGTGVEDLNFSGDSVAVEQQAFRGAANLESLTIEGTVTGLPADAFKDDVNLGEINISGMTGSIDSGAFAGCVSLETLNIPEGCESVDLNAFDGCIILGEVNFPSSVQSIQGDVGGFASQGTRIVSSVGTWVYQYCQDQGINTGRLTLTLISKYSAPSVIANVSAGQRITLPQMEAPDGFAFRGWYTGEDGTGKVTSPYTMPDSDTALYAIWTQSGNMASSNITQSEVTVSGVSGLRLDRYTGSEPILTIPESYISLAASSIPAGTEEVYIPASVTSIANGAFSQAVSLKAIHVDSANPKFYDIDGVLYARSGALIAVPRLLNLNSLDIPEGIKQINAKAMYYGTEESSLFSLTLPSTMRTIGTNALRGLSTETYVFGPESETLMTAVTGYGLRYNPCYAFFAVDDEIIAVYYVSAGEPLPAVEDPIMGGRIFLGWSDNDEGTLIPDDYTVPLGGASLRAVWDEWIDIPIDAAHFPDAAFRAYVAETFDGDGDGTLNPEEAMNAEWVRVGVWVWDGSGEDGFMTEEEAAHIRECYQDSITSFQGIEYLTGLRWLWAPDMSAMSGTLDLSHNTQLIGISIWNSGLDGIILGNLPNLDSIHCEDNPLGSLDVSGCPALRDIHAMNCGLSAIDLSHNPALQEVWLFENQLTELSMGQQPNLKILSVDKNQLTQLDLSTVPVLEELYCPGNQITALDVTGLNHLRVLHCSDNLLTSLDVSQNRNLTELYCFENQISTLDASGLTELTRLEASFMPALTSIDLGGLNKVEVLYLGGDNLTEVDLSDMTALVELEVWRNQLTELDLSGNPNLQYVAAQNNPYTSVNVNGAAALQVLSVWYSPLRTLDISMCPLLIAAVNGDYDGSDTRMDYFEYELAPDDWSALLVPPGTLLATEGERFSILVLPDALTEIEDGAFEGIAADAVVLPAGCTSVGSRAFADCPNLKTIWLPSGTAVAGDALTGSEHARLVRQE